MPEDTLVLPSFELQPLLENIVDPDTFKFESNAAQQIVTCIRALEAEIFIGCRDGSLMRYILPELDGGLAEAYMLLSRAATPDSKPVDDIQLVPTSGRILVLSDNKVYSYSYPNLDLISSEPPLKNALFICLDENPPTPPSRVGQCPTTEFCVIKQKAVTLHALREKIMYRKEIPLPADVDNPRIAKRIGDYLCLADSNIYSMIDLHQGMFQPLIPVSQSPEGPPAQPIIQMDENNNFLVLSWTGAVTMAIFLNTAGDPTGRIIEYPMKVSSLSVGTLNLVALLSDGSIQMHALETQSLIQEFPSSDHNSQAVSLVCNKTGTLLPSTLRRQRLHLVSYHLPPLEPDEEVPPPPISKSTPKVYKPTFTRSRIMLQCNNSVYSLTLRSRITQAEDLINVHRMKECKALLDRRPTSISGAPDPEEAEELRYLQLRLGYKYFTSTLFDDAGTWLFRGQLDPRLLISHFRDLSGTVLDTKAVYDIYSGLKDHIPQVSVEEVIETHSLLSSGAGQPEKAIEGDVKRQEARDMLREYLRKWRTKRVYEDRRHVNEELDSAVDTVFLRLLTERRQTEDLLAMLNEPNFVSWQDVEDDLIRHEQYFPLDKLYEQNGLDRRRVEILTKIVDGKYTEPFCADPLNVVFNIIGKSRDQELLLKWQFWLYERAPERCIELLISKDPNPKQSSKPQERTLLMQLRKLNEDASIPYLEHLVLKKRDKSAELHTMLARDSLRKACELLQELDLLNVLLQSQKNLMLDNQTESYLPAWISSFPTRYRAARLKCLLFLQASPSYEAKQLLEYLESTCGSESCTLERVLLYGRLDDHTRALAMLWRELGDSAAAELYCAQGGDILHPKLLEIALSTCEKELSLSPWVSYYQSRRRKNGTGMVLGSPDHNRLVAQLLDVYLNSESRSERHASRLLKSQAKAMDLESVIQSIPADWKLGSFEAFMSHKLRELESQKRESEIVKALNNSRNLTVSDKTHLRLRAEGFMVEEPDSGPESPTVSDSEKLVLLAEKDDVVFS